MRALDGESFLEVSNSLLEPFGGGKPAHCRMCNIIMYVCMHTVIQYIVLRMYTCTVVQSLSMHRNLYVHVRMLVRCTFIIIIYGYVCMYMYVRTIYIYFKSGQRVNLLKMMAQC